MAGDNPYALGGLVLALEAAWGAIQIWHPEIRPAAIRIGEGRRSGSPGLVLGHFGRGFWRRPEDEGDEIMISGECLAYGGDQVFGTLLHEAAHALAAARGVKDTSRQRRYHNGEYKALAEELLLAVEHDDRIGWSVTSLRPEAAGRYAAQISEIAAAIAACRSVPARPRKPRKPGPVTLRCMCREIRAAEATIDVGEILCRACGTLFRPDT